MTGRILRRKGGRFSVLDLHPDFLARINWLGREAQAALVSQDPAVWAKSDPDMLPRLVGGAIVLQRMTRPSKDHVIVLQDDGAHLSLFTCCALCLSSKKPDQELRSILEDTLRLLVMCCPHEVVMDSLPALSDLPPRYQTSPLVLAQYKTFPPNGDNQGVREIMLSDALILYRIFEKAPNPPVTTLAQLEKITAGVRLALQRLMKAAG